MSLACRVCGQEVSVGDRTCHNCGAVAPAQSRRSRRRTLMVVTALVAVAIAVWLVLA